VLELALAGRGSEATAAMAIGGPFAAVSSKLTTAMTAWKKATPKALLPLRNRITGANLGVRHAPSVRSSEASTSATVSKPASAGRCCSSAIQPITFFSAEMTVEWFRPPKKRPISL
jgi:hypothetical protein